MVGAAFGRQAAWLAVFGMFVGVVGMYRTWCDVFMSFYKLIQIVWTYWDGWTCLLFHANFWGNAWNWRNILTAGTIRM